MSSRIERAPRRGRSRRGFAPINRFSPCSLNVADAGFLVRRLHEPHPDAEQVRRDPRLDDCARLPYFLVFDLARG